MAVAALLIAALAYWWPILADLSGRITGGNGDQLLNAYLITWVAEHLGDAGLWNSPFFYPAAGVLAYSEHFIGLGAAAWPLVQAGIRPVALVNVLSIVASLSTSLAVYAWLRDRRSAPAPAAAAAAAIVVVYGAWRHLQIAHLQLLFTAGLPLALLCYARAIEARGQGRWAWLGGAALAMQTLLTPSLSVFMLPLVVAWLIVASLLERRRTWRHWTLLGASLAAVAVVNLPIARHYWQLGEMLHRTTVEVARHSATWVDWISAPPHWLYGEALTFTRGEERELFPGIGFAVITVVGVVTVVRARARLAIAGILTAALALWAATGLPADGWSVAHVPYELFRLMPGGEQVRVPARFVLPAAIFLAPAIAAGWTSVQTAVAARRGGVTAPILTLLLAGIVTAEALPDRARFEAALPLSAPAVPQETAPGAIVMLPLAAPYGPRGEIARMWSARLAGVPIVNGYSGHESTLYRQLRHLTATTPDAEGQTALYALLRYNRVTTIVAAEPAPAWIDPSRLRQTAPGVFQIPDDARAPRVSRIDMSRGVGLLVTESGWSYPEKNDRESWVWSTSQRATLRLPLGGEERRAIGLRARSQSDEGDELELWWGGRRLGVQRLGTAPALYELPLPDVTDDVEWIDLELRGPRPIRVPGSPDVRALSVCLFEIRLR